MPRFRRFVVLALFAAMMVSCFCLGYSASTPDSTDNQKGSALPATFLAPAATESPITGTTPRMVSDYGQLPLYFIENRGQVNRRVRYYVRGGGQTTFFTPKEVVLTLARPGKDPASSPFIKGLDGKFGDLQGIPPTSNPAPEAGPGVARASHRKSKTAQENLAVVRIKPVGLKKNAKLAGLHQTGHRVNYFIGNDPKKWRTDIPTYEAVVYKNAYAGIDLKFYGQGRQLEYDIVVQPGADPNQVKFAYQGVKKLEVTPAGDLALVLPDGGRLLQKKPLIYQEVAGQRLPVEGKYRLARQGARVTCGFALAAYDKTRTLVIDPVLVFSTCLGGTKWDSANALAVDYWGNVYLAGRTLSNNFPTQSPIYGYKGITGYDDVFVTKVSASGSALIYSTYLGGSVSEGASGIAVDGYGNAYVAGATASEDFPTRNPLQGILLGYWDGFVAKINPAGNDLAYCTYLGSSNTDSLHGIAVDLVGNTYVTGYTESGDFPGTDPPPPTPIYPYKSGADAFMIKIKPDGSEILLFTFLGGSGEDMGNDIAYFQGFVYIVGYTGSTDFLPLDNPFRTYKGSYDAFFVKMTSEVGTVYCSSYLGGSGEDRAKAVAVDKYGNAFITGITKSTDFPTTPNAPFPNLRGLSDAFVTRITNNSIYASTYLGGTGEGDEEAGYDIAVDPVKGRFVYVTGFTKSADFPVSHPLPGLGTYQGWGDAFVTKLDFLLELQFSQFSTYLGGESEDRGMAVGVDQQGNAYVTGYTRSADFPLKKPLYTFKNDDVFLSKIGYADVGGITDLLLLTP
jgi:hypothetical protein